MPRCERREYDASRRAHERTCIHPGFRGVWPGRFSERGMNVAVCICTFGKEEWAELAMSRAYPSALGQGATEILIEHDDDDSPGALSRVRNLAASKVDTDWLCFLDADDELSKGYLRAMQAAFEKDADGEEFMGDVIGPSNRLLVPAVQYVHRTHADLPVVLNRGLPLFEINRAVIGTLVGRNLFLEVGGFPEEPVYEDWACWLACEAAGAQLVDVPAAVYRAFVYPSGRNNGPEGPEVYQRYRAMYEGPSS